VHRILTNPACHGTFTYAGQPYEVEPLVDQATFQRIQEALRANQRRTQGHPKRDYLLRGFLKCKHCGKSLSGLYSRKCYRRKDGSLWTGGSRHYVCNAHQNHQDTALPQRCVLRYINADALELALSLHGMPMETLREEERFAEGHEDRLGVVGGGAGVAGVDAAGRGTADVRTQGQTRVRLLRHRPTP